MAPGKYKAFRIHEKRDGPSGSMYVVEWVRSPSEDTWTLEPEKKLIDMGCQPLITLFRGYSAWRAGAPEGESRTWADFYRNFPSQPTFASSRNGLGTCVLESLRTAAALLHVGDAFSEERAEAFERKKGTKLSNISWETLVRFVDFCNKLQRKAKQPHARIGSRSTNLAKKHMRGVLDFELPTGVYLCGAFNHSGVGHAFVLQSKGTSTIWCHDSTVGSKAVRFTKGKADWIRRWNFIQEIKLDIP